MNEKPCSAHATNAMVQKKLFLQLPRCSIFKLHWSIMHLPKFFLCDQSWIIWEYCVAKVTVEIFPSQILLVTKVSLNIFPIRDLFKGRQGPLDGGLLQPVQKFHRASPAAWSCNSWTLLLSILPQRRFSVVDHVVNKTLVQSLLPAASAQPPPWSPLQNSWGIVRSQDERRSLLQKSRPSWDISL